MLFGCSVEPSDAAHNINNKLLASSNDLNNEILKTTKNYAEELSSLSSCEKFAKNPLAQCLEFKINLARASALLYGLKTQSAALHQIIGHDGDARGLIFSTGDECDFLAIQK